MWFPRFNLDLFVTQTLDQGINHVHTLGGWVVGVGGLKTRVTTCQAGYIYTNVVWFLDLVHNLRFPVI